MLVVPSRISPLERFPVSVRKGKRDKKFLKFVFWKVTNCGPQMNEYYPRSCRQRNYFKGKPESLRTKVILLIVPMLVVPAELWILFPIIRRCAIYHLIIQKIFCQWCGQEKNE